jgi:dipeptidyl aminopeptidase/acylaminoacyl peptidase
MWSRGLGLGAALLISLLPVRAASDNGRAMELEDLFRLHRVSDPQISPDGRQVAYVITDVVKDENRTNSDIWLVDADGAGAPRQLTNSPRHDRHPRWSPDGKWIAFESMRDGDPQIFLLPIAGGEPRKLTTHFTGASQPNWSADGKSIVFVSAVFPEFSAKPFKESDKLNREKQEARDKSKVKARVFDQLLYRHWDSWVEDKRQHLFVVGVNPDGAAAGDPRDVTPGENDGVPTSDTFSAGDDFTFSPDGREIAFTAPPLPLREQAWSTNYDIWIVSLATGARRNVTADNLAADGFPRYSPDGKFLAYRAQKEPGFEADRWQLMLLELATGQRRSLTENWDYSANTFVWAPDGQTLFVEAQEKGGEPLWSVSVAGGDVHRLVNGGVNTAVDVSNDGRWLAYSHQQMNLPPEIVRYDLGGAAPKALTKTNADLLAPIALGTPESVTVAGAGGTPVQMWILKPPHFDPAKKYPFVFIVHGGPQSAWLDSWSTRWNAELWAAQGYVLALANPRGSTGFGQQFTNEISHDWGGKAFEDLLACLTFMKQQPYVDTTRMAAAGASYGGYMMNWFEGHVQDFRCIVNHDGVYNFDSMYGTTEEVWFDEHDHGKPWESPDYDKFSPHKYAAAWKTPMLIIHNDLDFRVPISEGMAAFTTLQRKGIPSKLLMFPDEGHWVLKPQNSELWHKTVFEWLDGYLKK